MKIFHCTMTTVLLAAFLAVSVGEAQHGHSAEPQDHFDVVTQRLELTAAQREALEEPFREMMTAMQELHRLHDVIARDLTDAQKPEFAQMFHEAMGAAEPKHGQGHHGEAHN